MCGALFLCVFMMYLSIVQPATLLQEAALALSLCR